MKRDYYIWSPYTIYGNIIPVSFNKLSVLSDTSNWGNNMLPLPWAVQNNTSIVVLRYIWTVFIPIKGALAGGMGWTGTVSMYLWTAVWCWWCIWNHHIKVHKHIDAVPVQHLHRINHDGGCWSFCRDGGRQDGYYTVTHIYRYF